MFILLNELILILILIHSVHTAHTAHIAHTGHIAHPEIFHTFRTNFKNQPYLHHKKSTRTRLVHLLLLMHYMWVIFFLLAYVGNLTEECLNRVLSTADHSVLHKELSINIYYGVSKHAKLARCVSQVHFAKNTSKKYT